MASAASRSLQRALGRRSFSILPAFPFHVPEETYQTFALARRGVDCDLNQSLAADGLTTRGEAYRNASVRDLCEFSERASVRVTRERALEVVGGPLATALKTAAFATDALPGVRVMDVEEFEGRLASARDDCLSFAPRLYVEDAAIGSSRASEVRVRVITDSPIVALHFRCLLHRTPLFNPQAFPRTLTLYASTLARESTGAGRGMAAPFTVVDCDPVKQRGHVLSVGPASLGALTEALALAAGTLQAGAGGYRSIPGGAHNPALAEARAEGVLPWYLRDGHVYAGAGEAHPALLPLRGTLVAGGSAAAGNSLVLGCAGGALEGAAGRAGRLLGAHHCVVELGEGGSAVAASAQWAGATLRAGSSGGSGSNGMGGAGVRGSLIAQGTVTVPLHTPTRQAAAPQRVLVVSTGSGSPAEAVAAAGGVGEAGKARLAALMASAGAPRVELVGSEAEALKALGL